MIADDLAALEPEGKTVSDLARALIDRFTAHPILNWELYE
jgi:hypothetical protein